MKKQIMSIFTRTPMHVGAGSSVGIVDLPIIRERHTDYPVIPGSSLKGVLADLWQEERDKNDKGGVSSAARAATRSGSSAWTATPRRPPQVTCSSAKAVLSSSRCAPPRRASLGAPARWRSDAICAMRVRRFSP